MEDLKIILESIVKLEGVLKQNIDLLKDKNVKSRVKYVYNKFKSSKHSDHSVLVDLFGNLFSGYDNINVNAINNLILDLNNDKINPLKIENYLNSNKFIFHKDFLTKSEVAIAKVKEATRITDKTIDTTTISGLSKTILKILKGEGILPDTKKFLSGKNRLDSKMSDKAYNALQKAVTNNLIRLYTKKEDTIENRERAKKDTDRIVKQILKKREEELKKYSKLAKSAKTVFTNYLSMVESWVY